VSLRRSRKHKKQESLTRTISTSTIPSKTSSSRTLGNSRWFTTNDF